MRRKKMSRRIRRRRISLTSIRRTGRRESEGERGKKEVETRKWGSLAESKWDLVFVHSNMKSGRWCLPRHPNNKVSELRNVISHITCYFSQASYRNKFLRQISLGEKSMLLEIIQFSSVYEEQTYSGHFNRRKFIIEPHGSGLSET